MPILLPRQELRRFSSQQQTIAGEGAPMPILLPRQELRRFRASSRRSQAKERRCRPASPARTAAIQSQQQTIAGEGAPMPSCFPGKNCGDSSQQQTIAGEGAPMPSCFPGKNCGDSEPAADDRRRRSADADLLPRQELRRFSSQQQTIAGEGAPMPSCFPGKNCGDSEPAADDRRRRSADAVLLPGKNCGDSSQQQMIAGEGAPMPSCFPGKNCGDSSQQQMIAGEGAPMPSCFPGKNCGDSAASSRR